MTISITDSFGVKTGDGSTRTFPFSGTGGIIYVADDLEVNVRLRSGKIITPQVRGVDYTISGAGTENPQITFTTAPADQVKIDVWRNTSETQNLNLTAGRSYDPEEVMLQLDKQMRVMQELRQHYFVLWRGDWATDSAYIAGESVERDGTSYTCTVAHTADTDNAPGTGTDYEEYWTVKGTSGSDGSDGAPGTDGTDGAAGRSVVNKGPWATATDYIYDADDADFVGNNGSGYLCRLSHTSDSTTEPGVGASWATYWTLAASKGTSGDGTGDLLSTNNLGDLADAAASRGNLGLGDAAESDVADFAAASHSHSADDITSDVLDHERGGLEADVSSFNGVLRVSGGTTTEVPLATTNEMEAGTETGLRAMSPSNVASAVATLGTGLGGGVPVGSIMAWPTATVPEGWLECDGSAVDRTEYADLFTALASTYGDGDGTTTFNLPDFRGEFLRGFDGGAANDPDRASRTDRGDGTTGDAVGTKQDDQLEAHSHTQNSHFSNGGSGAINGSLNPGTSPTGSTGGNETRPRNVSVMYIIYADGTVSTAGVSGSILTAGDIERIFTYRTSATHPSLPNYTSGLDDGRITLQDDPETPADPKVMRCQFNAGTRGHLQFLRDLGGPHEDVTLEFKFRFADAVGGAVDFQRGGKLPGLAGGTAPTGGAISSDGLGFSARYNWVEHSISSPDTNLSVYLYDMDNTGTGDHCRLSTTSPVRTRAQQSPSPYSSAYVLEDDTWIKLTQRVTMNSPGLDDGRIQVWLDDVLALDMSDLQLRANASLGVDCLLFSTFFGGGNVPDYQAAKDTWIYYGDFEITIHDTNTTIIIDLES